VVWDSWGLGRAETWIIFFQKGLGPTPVQSPLGSFEGVGERAFVKRGIGCGLDEWRFARGDEILYALLMNGRTDGKKNSA